MFKGERDDGTFYEIAQQRKRDIKK